MSAAGKLSCDSAVTRISQSTDASVAGAILCLPRCAPRRAAGRFGVRDGGRRVEVIFQKMNDDITLPQFQLAR